jgi:hypothetical protein
MAEKGFLGSLFDLSFAEFITTRVIKVLFVLAIIFAAIEALLMIVWGFGAGVLGGIALLIISPILFLFFVILARVWLELIIVIFRIAENTGRLAEQSPGAAAAPPASEPPPAQPS